MKRSILSISLISVSIIAGCTEIIPVKTEPEFNQGKMEWVQPSTNSQQTIWALKQGYSDAGIRVIEDLDDHGALVGVMRDRAGAPDIFIKSYASETGDNTSLTVDVTGDVTEIRKQRIIKEIKESFDRYLKSPY
jgi:hypothetical protein